MKLRAIGRTVFLQPDRLPKHSDIRVASFENHLDAQLYVATMNVYRLYVHLAEAKELQDKWENERMLARSSRGPSPSEISLDQPLTEEPLT